MKARVARMRSHRTSLKPETGTARASRRIPTRRQQSRTTRELARFRVILEAEHARLAAQLQALTSRVREGERLEGFGVDDPSDKGIGDVVRMLFERERGRVLESSVRQMLLQVQEALGRLEAGTYGNCKRCGRQIGSARLRVLPSATLCVPCKELAEGIGRQPGAPDGGLR